MTDYQAEYAAFRADVLSRVLPMPSISNWHKYQGEITLYFKQNVTAKQITAETWLEWDRERDDAFVQKLKTKFPTLYKSGD